MPIDFMVYKISISTVEGELCVASFLVNYFKRGPFQTLVAEDPMPGCTLRYRCHRKAGAGPSRSKRTAQHLYIQADDSSCYLRIFLLNYPAHVIICNGPEKTQNCPRVNGWQGPSESSRRYLHVRPIFLQTSYP
jgi:hypothetical protein